MSRSQDAVLVDLVYLVPHAIQPAVAVARVGELGERDETQATEAVCRALREMMILRSAAACCGREDVR